MTKPIWIETPDAAVLNELHQNTAVSQLGIEILNVGADYLSGVMPVDRRTMIKSAW